MDWASHDIACWSVIGAFNETGVVGGWRALSAAADGKHVLMKGIDNYLVVFPPARLPANARADVDLVARSHYTTAVTGYLGVDYGWTRFLPMSSVDAEVVIPAGVSLDMVRDGQVMDSFYGDTSIYHTAAQGLLQLDYLALRVYYPANTTTGSPLADQRRFLQP